MIIGKTKFIEDLYKKYIVDEYDNRIGDEINAKHLIISQICLKYE